MLLLTGSSDILQVISGSAVALAVHASYVDNSAGSITPGKANTAISTATTTTVVAAPGSSVYRNVRLLSVRNTSSSANCAVTIQNYDGTNTVPLWYGVLGAGMSVQMNEQGQFSVFSAGGIILGPVTTGGYFSNSSTSVSAGYFSSTYLAGSSILIPAQRPRAGTRVRWTFDMTKTAAGTAAPIIYVYYGANGSISDTAIATLTFGAGTAVADTGTFIVEGVWRSVGSSAVLQCNARLVNNLATTGLSSTVKSISATSSSHNSDTTSTYIGLAFNGGTSFSGTNNLVLAELFNL